MSEIINTYDFANPGKIIPMDRDDFYNEEIACAKQGLTGERCIEVVHIFLFNEHGELIVQKRSKEKKHNPNLLDKSIGGHVQHGDAPNLTAMIESIQELQTPSIVLNNEADFIRTYAILKDYLTTSAIIEYIDTRDMLSLKIINQEQVHIGNRAHTYFGIYAGRVKNVDKEAKGILYYSLDDLDEEMTEHPEIFTQDLREALIYYRKPMEQFLSRIA